MLLTVGQRKFSARIRFYSWFNYVNSRDPDVALSSTNTLVRTEAKRSSLILPPPSFFHDSTLPSPLFWHQKVHVDAVDRRREQAPLSQPSPFSWHCFLLDGFPCPARRAAAPNPAVEPGMARHGVEGEIGTGARRKQDRLFQWPCCLLA